MFFLQCTGPLGSVVEKLEDSPPGPIENIYIQGCPFRALGNVHDTEVEALSRAAEPRDLALSLALREPDNWFRNRLLERSDDTVRGRLEEAIPTVEGASPGEVAAAQMRVVTAAQKILALDGVSLPSVRAYTDLAQITDDEARRFLDNIGPTDLAVSMKTASDELKDRVLASATAEEVERVTSHMEELGPIRISFVQRVQLAMVQAVRTEDPLV